MKTKLILCFTLFTAALIGVSCGEASAQSEKGGHNKLADKDHHHDKDHHDKDHDPKREYDSLEKEIWDAVKEGKLSKRDAMEKLGILKEEMFGGHDKGHHCDKKDCDEKEKHEGHDMERAMVAVQVLMHAVKTGRMEEHHAKDMLWEIFAGEGNYHGEEHHRHHGEEHEREGRHHEREHEREGRHHEGEHEREGHHHEGEHDREGRHHEGEHEREGRHHEGEHEREGRHHEGEHDREGRHHGEEHDREGRHHREGGEEALYEAVARGLQAAVELGKMSKEEAKEVWRDMIEGEEE